METVITCPLGHKCEEARDGKVYRCAWYVTLAGENPNTGEVMGDEHGCAMQWMPVLQVEVAGTNRGQTQALNSFRNEVVRDNRNFMSLIKPAINQSKKIETAD